jgi:tRNA pseudouridine38-40 synthase
MSTDTTTHIVLILAYDGTAYYGWQKTKEGPSIEASLQAVLRQIFQEPIHLQAASRTDRGVHAEWQVVDFIAPRPWKDLHRLVISINDLLPPDIRCRHAFEAPTETFHPTLDVVKKRYRYLISTGPVQLPLLRLTHWHVHFPLDLPLLYESANLFVGAKDFRGLCNRRTDLKEEDTVRTVHSVRIQEDQSAQTLTVYIEADHFLYKMARNIVGTMVWIARGKIPLESIAIALQTRKRAIAGVTAPAHGLSLVDVMYDASALDRHKLQNQH